MPVSSSARPPQKGSHEQPEAPGSLAQGPAGGAVGCQPAQGEAPEPWKTTSCATKNKYNHDKTKQTTNQQTKNEDAAEQVEVEVQLEEEVRRRAGPGRAGRVAGGESGCGGASRVAGIEPGAGVGPAVGSRARREGRRGGGRYLMLLLNVLRCNC